MLSRREDAPIIIFLKKKVDIAGKIQTGEKNPVRVLNLGWRTAAAGLKPLAAARPNPPPLRAPGSQLTSSGARQLRAQAPPLAARPSLRRQKESSEKGRPSPFYTLNLAKTAGGESCGMLGERCGILRQRLLQCSGLASNRHVLVARRHVVHVHRRIFPVKAPHTYIPAPTITQESVR